MARRGNGKKWRPTKDVAQAQAANYAKRWDEEAQRLHQELTAYARRWNAQAQAAKTAQEHESAE